jgi:cobalt-zinc-cadmium resistance protein CzcA
VREHVKLPEGVSITWSGEFENQERAMARLAIIVPISILIIFLLLFDAFKSFASALVIIANIPFSVIGGILALYITGIYLSVSAAIGFIALFGISVMDGIVILSQYNQLIAAGLDRTAAILRTGELQLRPVLMTCIIAGIGLLPAAVSTGIGSQVQKPLAVVVVGGMMLAPAVILITLPVLIALFSRRTSTVPATAAVAAPAK